MMRAVIMRVVGVLLVSLLPFCVITIAHAEPVTLKLVNYGTNVQQWRAIADAFEAENPDIKIEVQFFPNTEYPTKIQVMFAAGTPPDIFQTWAQYKVQWITMGLLEDVTERWQNSKILQETEIYPFMMDAASFNGRIYGAPYGWNSTVYFVNRELLRQAGFDPPPENWTVEDMREIARKTTDPDQGIYGIGQRMGTGGQGILWWRNWTGHGWIDDAEERVLVNTPESVELVTWWYENLHHYKIAPHVENFPSRGPFEAGGFALNYAWMNAAFNFPDTLDWEMALFPAGPKDQKNFAQGHLWSMSPTTPHKDEAWRFLEWLASYDGQKAITELNRQQPIGPYQDLYDLYFEQLPGGKGPEVRDWVMGVLYGKGYAYNLTYWLTYPEMNDVMNTVLANVYNRHQAPGPALDDAARVMQQILDASKR